MSYVIKAVLSNPRRPECGQITIPFPIPVDQYDQTIEMLQEMDLGYSVNRECRVDEVDSHKTFTVCWAPSMARWSMWTSWTILRSGWTASVWARMSSSRPWPGS